MKQILLASVAVAMWLSANSQAVSDTFNYTGAVQTFTVPACVTSVTIVAKGAQGGAVTGYSPFPQGGMGATMQGDFTVNPSDVLTIVVGGRGNSDPSSSGGGGGSGVNNASTALIVAGGGAGVDFQDPSFAGQHAVTTTSGVTGNGSGGAGGTGGADGGDNIYSGVHISRGGRGWNFNSSGSLGQDGVSSNTTVTAGTWGLGGGGGSVGYGWCNCGGGGGGYSGGGSGQINQTGGGGGSYNIGTNQLNTAGNNTGNGMVIITYTPGVGVPSAPTGITGSSTVCEGSSQLTYFISPVGGATGYTWSVTGDATIASGQGTTAVDVQPGTMTTTISVTADNACGSSTAATFVLTVQPAPVIGLGPDVTQCGGTVTLDANNAGSTFMWSEGSTTQTIVVSSTGTYSVNVTDGNGCFANDTINVTINSNPVIALGNDTTVCNSTLLLDGGIVGAGYMWSDMSTNQTLLVTASGTYSVVVTDGNGCTGTDAITVTVGTTPTVTAMAPSMLCVDDNYWVLSGNPSGGTWSGPNPGLSGDTLFPAIAGAGTHQLIYTVVDSISGCSAADTASVMVDLCLNVNTVDANNFGITPNPNNGSFVVDFNMAAEKATIEVVDVTGKVVQSTSVNGIVNGTRATVNCDDQANGVYFVRVTANGESAVKKMMIVK